MATRTKAGGYLILTTWRILIGGVRVVDRRCLTPATVYASRSAAAREATRLNHYPAHDPYDTRTDPPRRVSPYGAAGDVVRPDYVQDGYRAHSVVSTDLAVREGWCSADEIGTPG